jgi:broad specificity phosphatase PhoE
MRIVLVRHGETAGQSSIRYYGATDVPLSALGRDQMERAAAALAGQRFDVVYSSALSRARDGAVLVAGRAPVIVPEFNEIDFGDWEGLTDAEISARDPGRHATWRAQAADFCYPGGESTSAFRTRVSTALRALLASAPGNALLFVLHKGVIRTILADLLQRDSAAHMQPEVDLGSIHVLQRARDIWEATQLDQIDHLRRASDTQPPR